MSIQKIGERIKQARVDIRISQRELSKALIVSEKAVSAYESGRTVPPLDTLEKIARRTNKPLWFFTDEPNEELLIASKLTMIEEELSEIKKLLAKKSKK